MANAERDIHVFKTDDADVIKKFQSIASSMGWEDTPISISFASLGGGASVSASISDIDSNEDIAPLLKRNTTALGRFAISHAFPLPNTRNTTSLSMTLTREDTSDVIKVTQHAQSGGPPTDKVALLFASIADEFDVLERTKSTDKILGDELAEFYRKREHGLLRLEQFSQKLIEDQADYQRQLHEQSETERKALEANYAERLKNLEAKFVERDAGLDKREADLDKRVQDIDDRASKHARREIQQQLLSRLEELDAQFTLSRSTTVKRRMIHVAYIAVMAATVTGAYFVIRSDPDFKNVATWIKLGLSTATFVGFVTAYIHWMNVWFDAHAKEEFRLKRFSLDVQRASWLIEASAEWYDGQTSAIPPALMERLSSGLFNADSSNGETPGSTLVSEILGSSSEMNVKTPSGSIQFDRKGIKKLSASDPN